MFISFDKTSHYHIPSKSGFQFLLYLGGKYDADLQADFPINFFDCAGMAVNRLGYFPEIFFVWVISMQLGGQMLMAAFDSFWV